MSRHKMVRNMNLDAVLDDYDGGADYDEDNVETDGEELTSHDKEQLQTGTAQVRSIIGLEVEVSDKEIQDSLWHYYYDVEKTVNYILNQKSVTPKSSSSRGTPKKAKDSAAGEIQLQGSRYQPFPVPHKDFFFDCPWLNIPEHCRAEIRIVPVYPQGRLLGGAPKEVPKMSKLAALAASRKKKENDRSLVDGTKTISSSVALLDKLNIKSKSTDMDNKLREAGVSTPRLEEDSIQPRKYPRKQQKSPSPPPLEEPKIPKEVTSETKSPIFPSLLRASPSAFAQILCGHSDKGGLPKPTLDASYQPFFEPYASSLNVANSNPFAGLSPDDIVSNAQSSSKGMKGVKTSSRAPDSDNAVIAVTSGISKTTMDDSPRATSKNLDVIAEYSKLVKKNAANFVVIGHVDAGKSTLMGRLLYDLKLVDQRTLDRYRKEAADIGKSSFALAWVLDQGSEERTRGVTIDIAMNKFETPTTVFTILDAPGHRDFIPNMIAGASQADFAVLVIDASAGNFESGLKGQTKEHALLVRSIGVQRLVVAINKLDTVEWSEKRYMDLSQQTSAFLTAAGFLAKNITFVPCSGLTGDNIARRISDPRASWYNGPILLETLESSEPITRALNSPLRLTIADVFRGGVQNPLSVSGRMDAGTVQIGDRILVVPGNESAYVKAIDTEDKASDWAVAGQNVVFHLSDIDAVHLKIGDVICHPSFPMPCVSKFGVKVLAFEHVTPMYVDVLKGRLHAPGRISELGSILNKSTGAVLKKKPKLIKPGEVARVVVTIENETGVPLEPGSRIVLRAGGETVAAGLVE